MRSGRLIALIDMDAFYVQVEVRDRPELQDKPVAVVQYNQIKNGGLIAVGYKARAEGVKRSMRADEALQKCPSLHLVSTPVRGHKSDLTKYRKASAEVFAVLNSFDENIVVEKASIDEAYLDLTKVVDRRIREEMVGEERLDSGRYPATYVLCPHVSAPEENREERLTEWLELCSREEEEMRLALAAETVERIRAAVLSQTKFHCSAVGERKRRSLAKKPKKTKKRKKMAAAAPGDIKTEPNAKIVYNAPFSEKNVYNVLLQNNGAHRIGWAIKTTNMKRLAVEPPAGCLDPKESQMLTIYCEPFAWGQEDTNNDRIFFEWTNTPEGAAKQFRREWFQGDGMVRRKNIPIECNP